MWFLKNKIDLLNQQAWDLRVSDSGQAFELKADLKEKEGGVLYFKPVTDNMPYPIISINHSSD